MQYIYIIFPFLLPLITSYPLPELNISPKETAIGGFSAGGYMTVQMLVAYSTEFHRGIIFGGGPFYACQGDWLNFWDICVNYTDNALFPIEKLIDYTRGKEKEGKIDPLINMKDHRVYHFHGSADELVTSAIGTSLQIYLNNFLTPKNYLYEGNIPSGHGIPTTNSGNTKCSTSDHPWRNQCNYDGANISLTHVFGELKPKGDAVGEMRVFAQKEYMVGGGSPGGIGMHERGRIYIPRLCAKGDRCRLFVFLHGCEMNDEELGDVFYAQTGFNEYAETNNIVILYPQVTMLEGSDPQKNPLTCWDFLGYTGEDYALKGAPQMEVLRTMIHSMYPKLKVDL